LNTAFRNKNLGRDIPNKELSSFNRSSKNVVRIAVVAKDEIAPGERGKENKKRSLHKEDAVRNNPKR